MSSVDRITRPPFEIHVLRTYAVWTLLCREGWVCTHTPAPVRYFVCTQCGSHGEGRRGVHIPIPSGTLRSTAGPPSATSHTPRTTSRRHLSGRLESECRGHPCTIRHVPPDGHCGSGLQPVLKKGVSVLKGSQSRHSLLSAQLRLCVMLCVSVFGGILLLAVPQQFH